MKKLLLILLCLPMIGFGQIGETTTITESIHVGYNNNFTKLHSLSYYVNEDGTKRYMLHFRNMEYQHIDTYDSFSFNATDEELEYVYNFFKEQMKNKQIKTLDIGGNTISASKMGKAVQISNISVGVPANYFWLLKKDLERLFGKR